MPATSSVDAQRLEWTPCADAKSIPRAECSRVSVPLCYEGLCSDTDNGNATIELRTLRCQALADAHNTTGSNASTIFALAHRPFAEELTSSFSEARGWVHDIRNWCSDTYSTSLNVYVLESRITNLSSRWTLASKWRGESTALPLSIEALEFLEKTLGAGHLEALSVTAAAMDLATVHPLLVPADRRVFMMAYDGDTRVLQRFLQLNSTKMVRDNAVQGYVLVGPNPMAARDRDERFGAYADRWQTRCDRNLNCFTERPTNYQPVYDMLDGKTEGNNCAHFIRQTLPRWLDEQHASFAFRFFLAVWPQGMKLLRSLDLENGLTNTIRRCNDDDLTALTNWLGQANRDMGFEKLEIKSFHAIEHFLQLTELWPDPAPTQAELDTRLGSTRVSDGFLAAQLAPRYLLVLADPGLLEADPLLQIGMLF
ncbi:hypothetical protein P43SY_002845 [Pythium insidiosum]|uniref:Uncharacterized protein n=1 Tax=Pythium insidiosum TaxID=114742 RepID=A0AAD5LTF8_PYTIN|nr:hypothetical protein P43SY_002845 [Pythium insidiosum]